MNQAIDTLSLRAIDFVMKIKAWLHSITAPKTPVSETDWWIRKLEIDSRVGAIGMITPHLEHGDVGAADCVLKDCEKWQAETGNLLKVCDAQWGGRRPPFPTSLDITDRQCNDNISAFDAWVGLYHGKRVCATDILWGYTRAKQRSRQTLIREQCAIEARRPKPDLEF
jgi:hypothetical protein